MIHSESLRHIVVILLLLVPFSVTGNDTFYTQGRTRFIRRCLCSGDEFNIIITLCVELFSGVI